MNIKRSKMKNQDLELLRLRKNVGNRNLWLFRQWGELLKKTTHSFWAGNFDY